MTYKSVRFKQYPKGVAVLLGYFHQAGTAKHVRMDKTPATESTRDPSAWGNYTPNGTACA
ncbi:hypothetical protein MCC01958_18310 [Bifidobacteriaceae bacterium MCC01958]|nr:hypothetical protein MCC01958_18310 [Bifidobacteriaceae bacterium MCC01958]